MYPHTFLGSRCPSCKQPNWKYQAYVVPLAIMGGAIVAAAAVLLVLNLCLLLGCTGVLQSFAARIVTRQLADQFGRSFSLSQFRGKKVLLINFASW